MQNDIVSLMDGTCATGNSISYALGSNIIREEEKPRTELRGIFLVFVQWPCRHI